MHKTQQLEIEYITNRNNQYLKYLKEYSDFYFLHVRPLIKKVNFKQNKEINFKIKNKKINLKTYSSELLLNGKFGVAKATAYLAEHEENIFLLTGDGIFLKININDLNSSNIISERVPSNITDIIVFPSIYSKWAKIISEDDIFGNVLYQPSYQAHGVKDLFIDHDMLYFSYSNKQENDCFNTSFLKAKMNYDFINIEKFFEPDHCVKLSNAQQGGRIDKYDKDKFIFSIGDWRIFEDRNKQFNIQNDDNIFGKIVLYDKNSKNLKILAKGLRNPQGLYYDKIDNRLLITDHGPKGGDEVNDLEIDIDGPPINFGWPIASYGTHYTKSDNRSFKSHEGFKEPIKYFSKSPAVSQIIKIPNSFINSNAKSFFLVTMGDNIDEGDMSIHYFEMDYSENKILNHEVFPVKERIRDIIYVEKKNMFLLFLDSTASIGILKLSD